MKKVLGAAIGSCVHVAGLHHFMRLAESEGYLPISMGPAVALHRLIQAIKAEQPDLVAVSYRLTPEVAATLLMELKLLISEAGLDSVRMVFGGTSPVAAIARDSGLFDQCFDGTESLDDIRMYLGGRNDARIGRLSSAQTLRERIVQKFPYPLFRHHFGRPTMQETTDGIRRIAESGVVDIISIGPDQNAQEHFFHPEEMEHSQDGAGGVPLRKAGDLMALYSASRTGNHPLMRCYAGTRDLLEWAKMSVDAIHNAWAAIPLCWYGVIDGRSHRSIRDAIRENQQVMQWYAQKDIPVEVNEAHQWSLRDAHDAMAVAMAFLAAYNAKKMGVKYYVAQFMFNTPPGTSPVMDLAKMLAKYELIEELQYDEFEVIREVRAGIAHFVPQKEMAIGQLAASAVISLSLKPHILHVVSHSEGRHVTSDVELIESCQVVHGVLHNCLHGLPDMSADKNVIRRKDELKDEARLLLKALVRFGGSRCKDPWSDPDILAEAIEVGLLDAPHFKGNPHLCGDISTRLINGGWYVVDPTTGKAISEETRLAHFFKTYKFV